MDPTLLAITLAIVFVALIWVAGYFIGPRSRRP